MWKRSEEGDRGTVCPVPLGLSIYGRPKQVTGCCAPTLSFSVSPSMGMLNRVFRRNSPKAPTAPDHGLSTLEAKPESSDGHQTGTPDGSPHLDALDVMADMIYRTGCTLGYFHYDQQLITGVCIRSKYGHIRSSPPAEPRFLEFERAVAALNAKVVAKIWCKPVEVVMRTLM